MRFVQKPVPEAFSDLEKNATEAADLDFLEWSKKFKPKNEPGGKGKKKGSHK